MIDNTALRDQIEQLHLDHPGWSGVRMAQWLAEAKEHRSRCTSKHCKCPLLWPAPDGEAYTARAVQMILKKVKQRLRAKADENRTHNRALAIARHDAAYRLAAASLNTRDMIAATSRRAELDGSHVAAEEAAQPSLYERVMEMMAQVVDYDGPESGEGTPLSPEMARFELRRLENLLVAAEDSLRKLAVVGSPLGKDEAARRIWRRDLLDEAAHQAAQAPGLSPERRRDSVARLVSAAAFTTEDADIAERQERVLKQLQGKTGAGG